MILYNVTINIDNTCHNEWLLWMRNQYIPDQMATGLFVKNTILRLMNEEDNGGVTYAFQYYLRTMDDLKQYEKNHGPRFEATHQRKYADKFVSFSTILEEVE